MVLNHGEISLIMIRQGIVTQPYSKKASIPSSTIGIDLLHFEHSHLTVCLTVGIPSKNSLIFVNCDELKDSINSINSALVESLALYISSSYQIYSIQSITILTTSSAVALSSVTPVIFCSVVKSG